MYLLKLIKFLIVPSQLIYKQSYYGFFRDLIKKIREKILTKRPFYSEFIFKHFFSIKEIYKRNAYYNKTYTKIKLTS